MANPRLSSSITSDLSLLLLSDLAHPELKLLYSWSTRMRMFSSNKMNFESINAGHSPITTAKTQNLIASDS